MGVTWVPTGYGRCRAKDDGQGVAKDCEQGSPAGVAKDDEQGEAKRRRISYGPYNKRWKRWRTEQKIPGPTREGEPVMVEVLTNLSVDNKKGWVYEEWTSLVDQRWKRWRTDQMFNRARGRYRDV